MTRAHRILWTVGAVVLLTSPFAWGATRVFDFNGPEYGNPDEPCANGPRPPLFNRPEYGGQTAAYIVDPAGCGQGMLGAGFGSDSYLTGELGDSANVLRFSWDTTPIAVTGANWTEAARQLTATGAFTRTAGDKITITAGSGVTPGTYTVSRRVDNDTIELVEDITTGGDVTDNSIEGTIDTAGTAWVRIPTIPYSYVVPLFPAPTVHLGVGSRISMRIVAYGLDASEIENPAAHIEVGLAIRETGLNLPLGEDGGASGSIEFVGFDSKGVGADPNTPVGGTTILHAGSFTSTTVEWTFVDDAGVVKADVRVDGGSPVRKPIVTLSGDGILAAANDRGTLDSLVIRKPATDTVTKKWFVWVDDLTIDAPGVTDPVKIRVPVVEYQTSVTVDFIAPTASAVKLYKDAVLIATATPPFNPGSGSHTFTGLEPLALGQVLTATQVVDGIESAPSAPVPVAKFGTIEDFSLGMVHYSSPPSPPNYREWYDVSGITWAYTAVATMDGSQCGKIWDGGWTNGVYAIFPSVFPKTGVFHVQCKMHVVEPDSTDIERTNKLMAYQIGVSVPGQHRGAGGLLPCQYYGSYAGLTTGNDTAKGPQIVRTQDFEANEGQDILIAFSSDVTSGGWNANSYTWYDPGNQTYVLVDDIVLVEGARPMTSCEDVPPVTPAGPLRAGDTTVRVAGVGPAADFVTVYVNGVQKGQLDTRTTGGGTKIVAISEPLMKGDVVRATQSYPDGNGGEIEGCAAASTAVVGTGPNPTGLLVTLGLRETSTTAVIGADGGCTGAIEWLGATDVVNGAPQGKLIEPSNEWQTVTFYPVASGGNPADPVRSYDGGNGVLNGGFVNRGVLEHIAFAPTPDNRDTGPFVLYIDNVTSGTTTFGHFEGDPPPSGYPAYTCGTAEVMFRNPRYLSLMKPHLLAEPSASVIDCTHGDNSAQSVRVEFQFTDEGTNRWVRVTTYSLYGIPSPYLPNPTVAFNQPISLRILFPPNENPCVAPTISAITPASGRQGSLLTGVQIAGENFVAGNTRVKLVMAGQPDIVATNVSVTDSGHLTCDLDLTSAVLGMYDLKVGTCAWATAPGAFEVKAGCATPPQDGDGDGDVDVNDFALFQVCFNGAGNPWPSTLPPETQQVCACMDKDADLDVDVNDFAVFQVCFNGAGSPPAASCPP